MKTNAEFNAQETKLMNWCILLSTIVTLVAGCVAHVLEWRFTASCCFMLIISGLTWSPFFLVAKNRRWKRVNEEKSRLQAKHDAQDKAMFGESQ